MEFYALLCEKFTSEEERMFLDNYRCYLEYDQEKDHVIDLEKVLDYIGYTRKNNAKRLLTNHFTIETDYRIFLPTEQKSDKGRPTEQILLTPNAFKEFCMKMKTEKAHQIRMYYIKMENIVMKHLFDITRQQNGELKRVNDHVKQLEKELQSLRQRRIRKQYEFGDTVYIVKEYGKERNVHKVGRSNKMNFREATYYSHGTLYKIVYTRRCKDMKALECAVHASLKEFTYNNRPDWFQIDFEHIREKVDTLQRIMDGCDMGFTIDEEAIADNNVDTTPMTIEIDDQDEIQKEIVLAKSPDRSFENFMKECALLSPEAKTSWVDLQGMYRLWARNTSTTRDDFNRYMEHAGYKKAYIYNPEDKTNILAYQGFSLKPLPPLTITNQSNDIEKFFYEKCTPNVTGRLSSFDIKSAFITWKKETDSTYTTLTNDDKIALRKYCDERFYGTTVHTGVRIRYGYYGVSFKGFEYVGKKHKNVNRKKITKMDAQGNPIATYDSITHAAKEEGVSISFMSNCIKLKRIFKDHVFSITK